MPDQRYHLKREGRPAETVTQAQLDQLKARYGVHRFNQYYTVTEVAGKPKDLEQPAPASTGGRPGRSAATPTPDASASE